MKLPKATKRVSGNMMFTIEVKHETGFDEIVHLILCLVEVYGESLPLTRSEAFDMVKRGYRMGYHYIMDWDELSEQTRENVIKRVSQLFPEIKPL